MLMSVLFLKSWLNWMCLLISYFSPICTYNIDGLCWVVKSPLSWKAAACDLWSVCTCKIFQITTKENGHSFLESPLYLSHKRIKYYTTRYTLTTYWSVCVNGKLKRRLCGFDATATSFFFVVHTHNHYVLRRLFSLSHNVPFGKKIHKPYMGFIKLCFVYDLFFFLFLSQDERLVQLKMKAMIMGCVCVLFPGIGEIQMIREKLEEG